MNYRDWKIWVKSKPWALKWFIILVLLRPIIDNLYFLKNISPFLSPLYIVGVLTPVLIIWAVVSTPKPYRSKADKYFYAWSVFLLIGTFFVMLFNPSSLEALEYLLKLSLPVYIFIFTKRFVRSKTDLNGILQTFLYSSIFVVLLLGYEVIFNPINTSESRGFERIQGSFGDVVSYSIYTTMSFFIGCYFFFERRKELSFTKRLRNVILIGIVVIVALINIHHIASYAIFTAVLLYFLVYNFKTNRGAAMVIAGLIMALFYIFGQSLIEEKVNPLLEKDVAVYEGKEASSQLLHGRVGRWQKMLDIYTDQGVLPQLFGYPLTFNYAYHFVGVGAHNDFIRIMFLSGYIGLYTYALLLLVLFKRTKSMRLPQKFLSRGILIILILYSISVVPTYYPPFMYIAMSIFAFICLPKPLYK